MPEQGGAGEGRRAWQDLPVSRRCVTSTGRVAILLSLVIHLAVVLPLVFGLGRGSTDRAQGSFILDTRVLGPVREVHFVLTGPDRATPKPPLPEPPEPAAAVGLPTIPPLLPDLFPGSPAPPVEIPGRDMGLVEQGEGRPAGENTGSGTGNGRTRFFQVAVEARSLVYVLDRSASMGLNGSWAAARQELIGSLEPLPASVRFQVIVYNGTPQILPIAGRRQLAAATPENKREVADHLNSVRAEAPPSTWPHSAWP